MPFNGSGSYSPPGTAYPAVASTLIESAKYNSVISDIATALSTCLTKDGQTTVTANLPMATYRHTGVGNAQALTDYASADQVVDNALTYGGASSGGTDTYAVSLSVSPGAYATGQRYQFIADVANTGACTINFNSLGAKSIKLANGSDPHNGAIQANSVADVIYDGTNFILLNPYVTIASLDAGLDDIAGLAVTDGNIIVGNGSNWVAESGATARSSLGLVINTDVQGVDSDVTGFVKGQTVFIDDAGLGTGFDIKANVTLTTDETVGPTGSGADHIYSVMDDMPSGATFAILSTHANVLTSTTTAESATLTAHAGHPSTTGTTNKITIASTAARTHASYQSTGYSDTYTFIPIDSSGRFEVYWTKNASNVWNVTTYFVGWGE